MLEDEPMAGLVYESPMIYDKYHKSDRHMIRAWISVFGLKQPEQFPIPILNYEKQNVPTFDVVLSPFSHSEGGKKWDYEQWNRVVEYLESKNIAYTILSNDQYYNNDITPFLGKNHTRNQSLDVVLSIIEKAKLVISIDNGISHLTHFLGTPHILLYPSDLFSKFWSMNFRENCTSLEGPVKDIKLEDVIGAIDHQLGMKDVNSICSDEVKKSGEVSSSVLPEVCGEVCTSTGCGC